MMISGYNLTLTKALSRFGWSKVPIGFTLTLKGEVTQRLPPNEGTLRECECSKAWSDLAMVGAWERVEVVVDKVLENVVPCTGSLYLVLRTRACGLRYLTLARSLLTHCTDITSENMVTVNIVMSTLTSFYCPSFRER